MTPDEQAIYLNGVPLVVLGLAYLAAGATLLPTLRAERRRLHAHDLALGLVLPCVGVAAAALGGVVLAAREPVGGRPWIVLAAVAVALVPAAVLLARRPASARVAETRPDEGGRVRTSVNTFTADLIRAETAEDVARLLARSVIDVLGVDFASFTLVEGGTARGLLALRGDDELDWWRTLEFDLDEPSAIASAAFEAAPFTVYDVAASPYVNQDVARQVGAKSGVWVPLVSGERVLAVVAAVTTVGPRVFSRDDLALLQELAAEAALALDRVRSGAALEEALGRERVVARIAQKVRSELDVDAVLQVAVSETAAATRVDRCLVRLGRADGDLPLAAEWAAEGLEPVGGRAGRLPASNLAAREGRTVVVCDVERADELDEPGLGGRRVLGELGTRAVLAAPIVVFGEPIGVLALHRRRSGDWSDDERATAEAVAHELGLALHTARLLAENERRVARQSALVEAAEALASELDFDAVISRLAEEVVRVLDADAADCWLFEESRGTLRCRAVHGLPAEVVGRSVSLEGTIGEAVATGRPVLKRDFARSEQPSPSEAYAAFAEVMDAPIVVGGTVRGALGVCAREPGRFREEDLDVLEAFASLAGLALRNAEQLAESSRQARIQRSFFRIAAVLAQPLAQAEALDAVAAAAAEGLGGTFSAVLVPERGSLELAGGRDLPDDLRGALAGGLPETENALRSAAAEDRVLAAPDVAADDRFGDELRAALAAAGARSLLAVPVRAPREEEGAGLVLVFFAEPHIVDDDDLELARHLAGAARGALERSALFEEERAARSLAQQLARTGALLATELDPAAVLEEVVRQAPALVGVEACAIRVLEGDELLLSAVSADDADADALLGERSAAGVRLSGDVIQSRAPLAVPDAAEDERLLAADPLLGLGYRGFLGVPLAGPEGTIHGVLAVYSRRPKGWRRDEIEALLALAANASAALSNAELYQRVAIEKERSFAILANIADGIVAVGRDGKVVLWNASAERITGVPAAEALGRTPFQVLGRHLESEHPPAGERPVAVLRGGEEVWLSLTEAVMRDPAGAVAGRIFAFRDVSADRLVEQMKSEFVSTISQELRRPLTSIYGFAETLLRTDVLFGDEERRTFLGYIASESERLTTIVDALLNVARLEAGDMQLEVVPTDVRSLVTEVVGSLADTVPAVDDHAFVVDLPEGPLAAQADPDKLRQVLLHLIENAVKFSPAGGTVTLAARRRADLVELSVADEGIGIPQAEQPRIFRKFYRGDPTRDSAGGTGLGLFIAQGLVAAMGGRIWVTSEEGEGSRFAFELPFSSAPVRESEAERVRASDGR